MESGTTVARRCAGALLALAALSAPPLRAQVVLQYFNGESNGNSPNQFAYSVSALGDLDGDSVGDFLVGAPSWAVGGCPLTAYAETGLASVISGKTRAILRNHFGNVPGCCGIFVCYGAGDRFGISVSALGDLDQDGWPDYVVGGDRAATDTGVARVFSGQLGSLLHTLNGTAAGDFFGNVVSAAGDVDQDGVPDLLVAAPFADLPFTANCGSVAVFSGASGSKLTTFFGSVTGAEMGTCDRLGDINGDGYDDVLVGAHFESSGSLTKNGRVSVFSGQAAAQQMQSLLFVLDGTANDEELGHRVAGAGDLNNDGYPDILAASRGTGTVYAFDSFGATLATIAAPASSVAFGDALAGAGDANGDGWGDFAVGDPGFGGGQGIVYVYSVPNGALQLVSTLPAFGGEPNGNFGFALAGVGHWETTGVGAGAWLDGDWNSDGLDDVVVGAPHEYNDQGKTWVYAPICLEPKAYCTSLANSSGKPAKIGHQGSLSVAANDFVLTANDCPPNKFGLFYYGSLQLSGVPFGCGLRCVGGTTYRFQVQNTGGSGSVAYPVNSANPPAMGTLVPGSTWNFQFWFRDPGACANGNVNFSDALNGTFCP